jgi:hypothetical protein
MNTALKLVSMSAAAAMVAACSHTTEREIVREQPIVQQAPAPAPAPATTVEHVTVLQPPPAPQETMPAPPSSSGYTWVPGHYAFRNGQWQWESGTWHAGAVPPMPPMLAEAVPEPPPYPNSRWVPGYWSLADNSWTWMKGHWQ